MSDVFLILHGTGGNKPDHWQEHLARELREFGADVRYPKMPDPDTPDLQAWLGTFREELERIPADARLTVLAHSRGCILWLHHTLSSEGAPVADRVLLVAPPYRTVATQQSQPLPGSSGWYPAPLDATRAAEAARETVIVASDDDELTTYEQAEDYARTLAIPIYKLSGAGHISPFYGYGPWPWVLDWSLRRADFPPLPNR